MLSGFHKSIGLDQLSLYMSHVQKISMIYKTSMLRSNKITNRSTSTSNLVELISISLHVPIAFSFTNGTLVFAKAAPNNWLLSVDRNILDRATREKACVNSFLLRDRGRCVPIQSFPDFFSPYSFLVSRSNCS